MQWFANHTKRQPSHPWCLPQVFGRDKSMSIVAVMSTDQCQAEFGALLQLSQQVRDRE